MNILALAEITPLLVAVIICWIFSVCVHEFAHALVAYWGGDTSVRDKGYLHFNILAYVHPIYSIALPALFLLMGGLPFPGGAVYIDHSALRNRHWQAFVAAAGPISNFILFLILAALVHPASGLIDPDRADQRMWAIVLGTMCVLELYSVFFNLIPIPPLDGFGIIEPYLDHDARMKFRSMGVGGIFIVFFMFRYDPIREFFWGMIDRMFDILDLPFETTWRFYNITFFGISE